MDEIAVRNYLVPFLGAFLLTAIITYLVRRLSLRLKLFDLPDASRKVHYKPVPLWGGLSIYLAVSILLIIFWRSDMLSDGRITQSHLIGILLGGGLLMIGGFLDDKFNLKPYQTIIWPVLAAALMVYAGLSIKYITNPAGGLLYFGSSLISSIFVFFWLLGMMYTTKFLDGLDGLVAGIATIGSIILFVVSLFWDVALSGTSILCLIFAGSAAGFLLWNFHPAKIFLGEGGSLYLGFMLGVLSLISGAKIATALLIMGLPILDAAWVIFRRIFKEKKSPFIGDGKHLHFRLLNVGLSQRKAVLFLYLITTIFGTISLFQNTIGKIIALIFLLLMMLFLALALVKMNVKEPSD